MLRHRWDTAILACLDKPTRFRALAREVDDRLGERIEDNALDRSLKRLVRTGLVLKQPTHIGRRVVPYYQLTDKGEQRCTQYRALVSTYQRFATSDGHQPGTPGQRPAPERRQVAED
jgi:DNA-binding HxlR family transcriptional regulator